MRHREQRKPVLIPARMRVGARWLDARILNISSRGLMLRADDPPPRGSYLELRRGSHTIVARVMWTDDDKLGVLSQDVIAAHEIIGDLPPPAGASFPAVERRTGARSPAVAHEASRWRGRSVEFLGIAAIGAVLGGGALAAVSNLLGAPLAAVGAVLR